MYRTKITNCSKSYFATISQDFNKKILALTSANSQAQQCINKPIWSELFGPSQLEKDQLLVIGNDEHVFASLAPDKSFAFACSSLANIKPLVKTK